MKPDPCSLCIHSQIKSFEDKTPICSWHGHDLKEDSKARDFDCEYYESSKF